MLNFHNGVLHEFCSTMKLVFSLGSLLLCVSPLVGAGSNPAHPVQVQASVVILPEAPSTGESRGPMRLRDALRFSDGDGGPEEVKPYRLSTEERQRLREQLRSQSFDQQPGK